jgi:anti-sigma B factor antagonist
MRLDDLAWRRRIKAIHAKQGAPMKNFSVRFQETHAVTVLALTGELDAHTASELEAAFEKCRKDENHQIVVNCARLRYISSAGLGVFLGRIDAIREQGGDIKIAALMPNVFNVFDLLGFPLLFNIVDTEEEAITLFAS